MTPLTPRQAQFVVEYLTDHNATQAAIRAGYSPKTANREGTRLLSNVVIKAAIDAKQSDLNAKVGLTSERVLKELMHLGFSDMRDYLRFGEKGEVWLDWTNMPPDATRAIAEITQEEYVEGAGETARPVKRTKFKLYPKTPALELLARRLKLAVGEKEDEDGAQQPRTVFVVFGREVHL